MFYFVITSGASRVWLGILWSVIFDYEIHNNLITLVETLHIFWPSERQHAPEFCLQIEQAALSVNLDHSRLRGTSLRSLDGGSLCPLRASTREGVLGYGLLSKARDNTPNYQQHGEGQS